MITRMNRGLVVATILSTMMLAGCVSRSRYDALQAQNEQLHQQVATQSAQMAADKSQIAADKAQISRLQAAITRLLECAGHRAAEHDLVVNCRKRARNLDAFQRRLGHAIRAHFAFGCAQIDAVTAGTGRYRHGNEELAHETAPNPTGQTAEA